ncbi:hypothetical protein DL93DRAFT_2091510 [Clavulina sp. PMI_390]|nr:hypothetical protein DL93DRAFT_2091510 [Clavulina sp. PMI_390]
MLPSFIRRRQRSEDPLAPDRKNWADELMTRLLFVIFMVFGAGGFLMFLGGSLVSRLSVSETSTS